MNKRQIIASLNNIANSLDNSGFFKEANALSSVMTKVAQQVPQNQQAYGQQNPQQNPQPNSQRMNIINESNRLGNELEHYREKFMSLFEETKRKIDSGIQMEEKKWSS